MAGLEAEDDEDDGGGYLGRFEALSPEGLCGLNILKGSTVGLSHSSGAGRLMKSSSSGTSRDPEAMFARLNVY
jgi:hypothetical protein